MIWRLRSLNRKIGVVSSRLAFADYIIPLLKECGMGNMIDLVVNSKDVAASKPSPEPFLPTAKKLNSDVKECVVVGDSPEDIIAGKAANMMTVAYTGGFYSLDELSKCDADLVIDDLTKLIHLAHTCF